MLSIINNKRKHLDEEYYNRNNHNHSRNRNRNCNKMNSSMNASLVASSTTVPVPAAVLQKQQKGDSDSDIDSDIDNYYDVATAAAAAAAAATEQEQEQEQEQEYQHPYMSLYPMANNTDPEAVIAPEPETETEVVAVAVTETSTNNNDASYYSMNNDNNTVPDYGGGVPSSKAVIETPVSLSLSPDAVMSTTNTTTVPETEADYAFEVEGESEGDAEVDVDSDYTFEAIAEADADADAEANNHLLLVDTTPVISSSSPSSTSPSPDAVMSTAKITHTKTTTINKPEEGHQQQQQQQQEQLDDNDDNDDEINEIKEVDALVSKEILKLSFYDRQKVEEEIHGVKCMAINENGNENGTTSSSTPTTASSSATSSSSSALFIEESLYQFHLELNLLNHQYPTGIGSGGGPVILKAYKYILMSRRATATINATINATNNNNNNNNNNSSGASPPPIASYIDTNEFRIRFIRCELFNIKNAVNRFLCYLNFIHESWGIQILMQNSCLSLKDLTKYESKLLSMGIIQVLPYRDRSGRRVVAIAGHGIIDHYNDLDPITLFKLMFFLLDWVTRDSAESQRNGIVVVWESSCMNGHRGPVAAESGATTAVTTTITDTREEDVTKLENNLSIIKIIFKKVQSSTPTRIVCVHTCWPDTQFLRVYAKLFILRASIDDGEGNGYGNNDGNDGNGNGSSSFSSSSILIHKVKFHFGDQNDIHTKLQTYGVPIQLLPITASGKIKLDYHKQWMTTISLICNQKLQQQQAIQQQRQPPKIRTIVECPCFNDVVFRVGKTSTDNPGNVTFRNMILTYLENEEEQEEKDHCGNISKGAITTTAITAITAAEKKKTKVKKQQQKQSHLTWGNNNNNNNDRQNRIFLYTIINDTDKRNGRFLERDETNKYWVQMDDINQIQQKVMMTLYSWRKRRKNAKWGWIREYK